MGGWNVGTMEPWNFSHPILQQSSIPIPHALWSDLSLVLDYKLYPMSSKYGCNMVTDMRCGAEHKLVFAMNSNIFQAEEKNPIFHHSITPSFQSHDLEALDRL